MRQARIRQGMYRGGKAPVLKSTIRSRRCRIRSSRAKTDRPAPILRDECHTIEPERLNEVAQIINVIIQRKKSLRLVTQPATDMIRRNASKSRSQRRNEPPPMKRPGGIAVDEKQCPRAITIKKIRRAFIDVMHPAECGARFVPMGLERIKLPPIFGRHLGFTVCHASIVLAGVSRVNGGVRCWVLAVRLNSDS